MVNYSQPVMTSGPRRYLIKHTLGKDKDMDNKIRILTADAGEEFRSLLNDALSEEPDMEVIASTGDGQEAIRLAKELVPDVVAMDLVLTRMDGLEVLCELASLTPRPRVLVISSFASGAVAAHAASAGADYYLMKRCRAHPPALRAHPARPGGGRLDGRQGAEPGEHGHLHHT